MKTKLKKLREINELTQEEVAKIMGVKREIISYYENGKRVISVTKLQKLLDFLGLELSDLKNGNYKSKVLVAYKKVDISDESFEQVIWLNRFVMNLEKVKQLNQGGGW